MTTQIIQEERLNSKGNKRGVSEKSQANLFIGRAKLAELAAQGLTTHPEGYSLKARLLNALKHPLEKPKDDAPSGDHIVYATLKGAIELVPVAFKETWDRGEGKVLGDGVQVNFNEIKILVVYEDRRRLNGDAIQLPANSLPEGTRINP